MKIKKIKISWFRGSSDPIELDFISKSLVLYGENGAGKSTFVDAIEYNINNGKINHLTHEYSGKRQEKAVVNTHIPGSQNGEIFITLEDNSIVETRILKNGSFTITPTTSEITSWDYRSTVLRQNEVADFITDTKGNKSFVNKVLHDNILINDNPIKFNGILTTYDFVNNEFLYTFLNSFTDGRATEEEKYTLCYSDLTNAFKSANQRSLVPALGKCVGYQAVDYFYPVAGFVVRHGSGPTYSYLKK